MSTQDKSLCRETAVSRLVERLALDLVIAEGPPESVPDRIAQSLAEIQHLAQEAGYSVAAAAAAELAAPVHDALSGATEWSMVEGGLQAGLIRLQEAVAAAEQPEAPATPAAPAPLALHEDPELINDFVLETSEHLASIEVQLLTLEQEPQNPDAIHSVFRSFHTIKGLAGFLELQEIREAAHEVETALDLARNGELSITPSVIDVVLACADFLKLWVEALRLRTAGQAFTQPPPPSTLIEQIRKLRAGAPAAALNTEQTPEVATARVAAEEASPEVSKKSCAGEARTVKVDTTKLDALVDMVGEMVIAQSLVRHDPDLSGVRTPRLLRNLSQLARTTDELQKTAMSMRMVPVGHLFQKMARLTRDLARKSAKQVEMELSGEETELDRNLVEELADPLMHMVRNAVDHGLESSEERVRTGKRPAGRVHLRASHQAGHIVIELSDDGRGLNRDRILAKAREKGLIDPSTVLSDAEIDNLIFRPGFSTAEKVTDVSGRGVGMDVVRKQLQKMRGRVEINSTAGRGTVFTLKLPLTLAIIDGLVVGVGQERYIIPLFSVREVLRPTPDMISTIEGRAEMALVRDRLVPVIRLYVRFGITPKSEDPCQSVLVISESGTRAFGLMVDDLIGKQEVVIKSLGDSLKDFQGVAGGAILGDGRVGLVLDTDGVFAVREVCTRG